MCRDQRTNSIVNEEETNLVYDNEVDDGYAPVATVGESKFVPALWNSALLMNDYHDCGMHLVFHGVLAYCVEKRIFLLADHGLTQKCERLVNSYLLDIQSLRLEWCKMK